MGEMILPGVYINVHPEGLIAPGQITIGNLGVVGTAARGDIGTPVLIGSFDQANKEFYAYDPWLDPITNQLNPNALTLVRALEQAFQFGATTVYAVRVAGNSAKAATLTIKSQTGKPLPLRAAKNVNGQIVDQPGTWGNHLSIDVDLNAVKDQHPFIDSEIVNPTGGNFMLRRPADPKSQRNRVTITNNGVVTTLQMVANSPGPGQVQVSGKKLTFNGPPPPASAVVTASYIANVSAQQVTIHFDSATEVYQVADVADLVSHLVNESSWVMGDPKTTLTEPLAGIPATAPAKFLGGDDGAAVDPSAPGAIYQPGLDALLNVDAHIIVAAGQDDRFGPSLERHCALASTDALKRDRIAIVGSRMINPQQPDNPDPKVDTFFDTLVGHNLASDRLIFVAPGMQAADSALQQEVTLPGAYSAAAVAGLIASFDPEVSPTNKTLDVDGLEYSFDTTHLTVMVQNRILALEVRSGFRIVKGITTDDGAFRQITTRRIVDYAKYGVRAAAEPYIGLLNDERVRGALRGTINSFLTDMVNAEMLESYELDVTATRAEEIQGIARVTMSLQPVFSIDFIVVDIFLG
jgi:hypothetical protein